jgi:esterase/lipase
MEQIVFDRSLSNTINRLKLPTLLLYGQHDLIAPVEVGGFIYDEIGTETNDKKLVILSESRHGAEGSDIVISQQEVTSFIEKYRTGSD